MEKNIFDIKESYNGFRFIGFEEIDEIDGNGYIFIHEKSGVRLIALENEDPLMTFSIGFRTLSENNKGTAHILEHTVCCASDKYRLKETLTVLEQGSICTTINACTYPDMTMYYVASPSEKDLLGVAKVFIDMVFHPRIYSSSDYFRQEGWCYEVGEDEELEYGGVVYNEMEGAYAEATTYLEHETYSTLFKDTPYEYDSGGIPEYIPTLEEEEVLEFHKKYYRGDNCVITLYGVGDIRKKLKYLDENGLAGICSSTETGEYPTMSAQEQGFDLEDKKPECDNVLENKKPECNNVLEKKKVFYPLEGQDEKTILSLSYIVNDYVNEELRLAFEILEHMLLKSSASPLLEQLITKNRLGLSLSEGGYDTSADKCIFSIILNGVSEDVSDEFEKTVYEVLNKLVKEGIPTELMDASINTLLFSLKEKDAAYEPIGIQYSEMVTKNSFYNANPIKALRYQEAMEKMVGLKQKGYFEFIIQKYLLQNKDAVLIAMEPSEEMALKRVSKKESELQEVREKLTIEEFRNIIDEEDRLKELQEKENSLEEIKTLPHLTKNDLPRSIKARHSKRIDVVESEIIIEEDNTHGIAYVNLLFNTSHILKEDIPYIGVIAQLLSYVGSSDKSYHDIENEINTHTGGLNCSVQCYLDKKAGDYTPIFKLSSKLLIENVSLWKNLILDLLHNTVFKEKEKIKELIAHTVYEMERSFKSASEYHSVQNIYTHISAEGKYINMVGGIEFYKFLRRINNDFEKSYEHLVIKLQEIISILFRRNKSKIAILVSKDDTKTILQEVEGIIKTLPVIEDEGDFKPHLNNTTNGLNEAFIVEQEVQSISSGVNLAQHGYKYNGSMEVVMNILESTYLWDRVRLQGGAYGTEISLSEEGYLVLSSYCDPNISKTLNVFDSVADYLEELEIDEELFERYIIGTLGAFLTPLSMERKIDRLSYLICTNTDSSRKVKLYEEILNSNKHCIKDCIELFRCFKNHRVYSVIGNKDSIYKEKILFDTIYKNI